MSVKLEKATTYGKNEYGEYWKFENGLLICAGKLMKTFTIKNGSTGGYYDDGYSITFPYDFIDTDYNITISLNSNNAIVFIYATTNSRKDLATFHVFSHAEKENVAMKVSFIAIGRWK